MPLPEIYAYDGMRSIRASPLYKPYRRAVLHVVEGNDPACQEWFMKRVAWMRGEA